MSSQETVSPLPDETLVELARWMCGAATGGWSPDALRSLAGGRGWRVEDGSGDAGPVVRTGLPSGDGRLLPVGEYEAPYVSDGEAFVGLAVPVGVAGASALEQAECFRRVGEVLARELGPAGLAGAYGYPGPFFAGGPAWGTPFLRWRRPAPGDSIELRAGDRGPELVLMPTRPVESWLWRQGHGEPFALGGFLGVRYQGEGGRPTPYGHTTEGLGLPGPWQAPDWGVFQSALADWLATASAERHALDVEIAPIIHGDHEFGLDIFPDSRRMLIGGSLPGTVDARALGWIAPPVADDPYSGGPNWRLLGSGPGELDAQHMAKVVVQSAQACGLTSPDSLRLLGEGCYVHLGGNLYRVTYYGLGVATVV